MFKGGGKYLINDTVIFVNIHLSGELLRHVQANRNTLLGQICNLYPMKFQPHMTLMELHVDGNVSKYFIKDNVLNPEIVEIITNSVIAYLQYISIVPTQQFAIFGTEQKHIVQIFNIEPNYQNTTAINTVDGIMATYGMKLVEKQEDNKITYNHNEQPVFVVPMHTLTWVPHVSIANSEDISCAYYKNPTMKVGNPYSPDLTEFMKHAVIYPYVITPLSEFQSIHIACKNAIENINNEIEVNLNSRQIIRSLSPTLNVESPPFVPKIPTPILPPQPSVKPMEHKLSIIRPQKGGDYYQKYIKYKQKYIHLKGKMKI